MGRRRQPSKGVLVSVYTTNDDELCCPLCGDSNTHVDRVSVAARPAGEDGLVLSIGVHTNGVVGVLPDADIPPSRHVGVGRRHRIALIGWCENCGDEFALLFTQHKGVTLVESIGLGEHLSVNREAS